MLFSITSTLKTLRKQNHLRGEKSTWWYFIFRWPKDEMNAITSFMNGTYRFEPIKTYNIKGESGVVWTFKDRLFVKALLSIIKPLFKHIISPSCFHIKGPSGVPLVLDLTQKALEKGTFRYFIRADIKGYYASIDRKILSEQTKELFNDFRVLNYLDQIIHIPIIENAAITNPTTGIHRRSSLSPFLSALYLSPLDKVFENRSDVFYARYCDDIIVLTKTKKQFVKAKRQLREILKKLKLQYSRRKTKMGLLTKGFHFLGINFSKVNQEFSTLSVNTEKQDNPIVKAAGAQTQQLLQFHVNITLHERCCVRAMNRIENMKADFVHPKQIQIYLSRWATWWCRSAPVMSVSKAVCIQRWIERAAVKKPELAWMGVALLRPLLPFQFLSLDQITA